MPATPADLMAMLDRLGLAVTTATHAPVFTVADARSVRHEITGAHTKNLFLADKKGRLFLVTAEEEAAIDLKHLHQRLGATGRFSFGTPELLMATLGVAPGAVTPFAAINDLEQRVTVVLDPALVAAGRINAHPLVNTATTAISAADLVAFLKATGHDPLIVAVAEAPSSETVGAGEL
jgi:Ala-tRNA(Pro) deacylase